MPNQMERFTRRARRVLALSQQEAENAKQFTIEPEHLLIAMWRDEDSVSGVILRKLGFDEKKIRDMADTWLKRVKRHPIIFDDVRELSQDTRRLLERSVDAARKWGHHYIGSEHLLIAYVWIRGNEIPNEYRQMGMTFQSIKRNIRQALRDVPEMKEPMVSAVESLDLNLVTSAAQIIPIEKSPAETVEIDLTKLLGKIHTIKSPNLDLKSGIITFEVLRERATSASDDFSI